MLDDWSHNISQTMTSHLCYGQVGIYSEERELLISNKTFSPSLASDAALHNQQLPTLHVSPTTSSFSHYVSCRRWPAVQEYLIPCEAVTRLLSNNFQDVIAELLIRVNALSNERMYSSIASMLPFSSYTFCAISS